MGRALHKLSLRSARTARFVHNRPTYGLESGSISRIIDTVGGAACREGRLFGSVECANNVALSAVYSQTPPDARVSEAALRGSSAPRVQSLLCRRPRQLPRRRALFGSRRGARLLRRPGHCNEAIGRPKWGEFSAPRAAWRVRRAMASASSAPGVAPPSDPPRYPGKPGGVRSGHEPRRRAWGQRCDRREDLPAWTPALKTPAAPYHFPADAQWTPVDSLTRPLPDDNVNGLRFSDPNPRIPPPVPPTLRPSSGLLVSTGGRSAPKIWLYTFTRLLLELGEAPRCGQGRITQILVLSGCRKNRHDNCR